MISKVSEHQLSAKVVAIHWERIFLHIDVKIETSKGFNASKPLIFYVVNGLYKVKCIPKYVINDDGIYTLTMNITNNGENRVFPVGAYHIFVCQGDCKLAVCMFDESIVGKAADFSRNFLYNGKKKVYTVSFFVEEGGEDLPFIIYMMASARTGVDFPSNKRFRSVINIKPGLKSWLFSKKSIIRRLYKYYARKYKKNKNHTILFMTEQNDTIASNLKAVSDRMIERGMDKEFDITFSARPAAAKPQTRSSWIGLIKKLAGSGWIFLDDHAPVLDWLTLTKDTTVIQLWHAGAGFKSSGYSRWGHLGCPAPSSCHRQYKYGIAGSREIAPFFSEVWGINDIQVLPTGMPRMDEYLDENHKAEKIKELYEQFPFCKGKKVMLFAPTYRGTNKKTAYYPYDMIDFERMYELCGDEYVVLFKMHPWVNVDIEIPEQYSDKFISVLSYPNINDLFYITDLLITDYSSSIFEFSLMRKPMMFFAFDKIQYSFSRGFHRDYEDAAPGKVCYTFDELMDAFEKKDFEFEKVERYISHHFDYIDSGASDRVIDWIIYDKMPQDIKDEMDRIEAQNKHMRKIDFSPKKIGEVQELASEEIIQIEDCDDE